MKRYGWIQVFSRGSATGAGLKKRTGLSIYAYCSGDPINKVDLDGCDEWEISENGHIVRHVETKEHDAFFIVDKDGNRIEGKSISFEYGTVTEQKRSKGNTDSTLDSYNIKGDDNLRNAFEFLATNTKVEWSEIGYTDESKNQLITSHQENKVTGTDEFVEQAIALSLTISYMIHSHPGGTPFPSGLEERNTGDIGFANWVVNKTKSLPLFGIYIPGVDENPYIYYGPYTTASSLNLPPFIEVLDAFEVKFNK